VSATVRRARSDDAAGIAEVHVHAWQAAYRGLLPDPLLDGLSVSEREESWRSLLEEEGDWLTFVAEDGAGGLAGFCSAAIPNQDQETGEGTAEIGAIYVDPGRWREGIGGALLSAALAALRERGWREVVLWVLPENRAALAFYDRFGFAIEVGVEKREERSGRLVVRLRADLTDSDEPIQLAPYDPAWPGRFVEERAELEAAIGEWVTGGIHHVGSTAVPGLAAKPIVDILVGVEGLEVSRGCFEPLARLDYLYAPYRTEEMHWFCKPNPARRTHHLHLVPTGSGRFQDELAFRDRLRADPAAAAKYAALKSELADRYRDDREAYTDAKAGFISNLLDKADENRP
jgi:GrpB-like predicted nucleotidyltransferase (UPF0157 family)/ribosomal protein S18 acetylase RimI-like enzyme